MAINLAGRDAVGVFTKDFNQVFPNARPLKATIKETSKLMEHPLETGATTTDHRIINPTEIEFSLLLNSIDYRSVYQQIKQLRDSATLLTVVTWAGRYDNQLISDFPHEEDPAMYEVLSVALKTKEVLFAKSQSTIVPRDPSKSSTKDKGNQQTKDASGAQTDQATTLYKETFGRKK